MDSIRLHLIYDGNGPINWGRQPGTFGLQDKSGRLHPGVPGPASTTSFDLALHVNTGKSGQPVLLGDVAHGPPGGRFLYLAWCEPDGTIVQRLKLPLGGMTWDDIHQAVARRQPLLGRLIDHRPRVTSTGANIGGTRAIAWRLP